MQAWCGRYGHEIVEEFREQGASATDDNRPVFREMIQYALDRRNAVEAILVLTTSRFFRDALGARMYKKELAKAHIRVIAITQEVSDDPTGEFVEQIFEAHDQLESSMNGFHTLRGMNENARRGFFNGSTPPFGYRVEIISEGGKDRKVLVPNEEEAAIVRRAFDLYVDGLDGRRVGVKRIAEILNAEGKLFRGKTWSKQRVQERLADTVYRGEYYFNRKGRKTGAKPRSQWIPISVPPLVDAEVFSRAARIREENLPSPQRPPSVTASPLLLTGVFVCSKCGARMQLETAKGGKYRYYNCSNFTRRGKNACPGNRVAQAEIERRILEHLAEKVFSISRVQKIVRNLVTLVARARSDNREKVNELKREIEELESLIRKYLAAFENGEMQPGDVGERVKELRSKQEAVKRQLERLTSSHQIPPYVHTTGFLTRFCESLKHVFLTNGNGMAKRYVRLLVSRISVTGQQITIETNTAALFGVACAAAINNGTADWLTPVLTVDLSWLLGADSNHQPTG